MSQSNQSPDPFKGKNIVNNVAVFSVGAEVGCATLVIVLIALFAGIGLDKLLGTKPVLTILFTLGSAPLALYITYWLAMRAVKNINPKNPAKDPEKSVEEEKERE